MVLEKKISQRKMIFGQLKNITYFYKLFSLNLFDKQFYLPLKKIKKIKRLFFNPFKLPSNIKK